MSTQRLCVFIVARLPELQVGLSQQALQPRWQMVQWCGSTLGLQPTGHQLRRTALATELLRTAITCTSALLLERLDRLPRFTQSSVEMKRRWLTLSHQMEVRLGAQRSTSLGQPINTKSATLLQGQFALATQ